MEKKDNTNENEKGKVVTPHVDGVNKAPVKRGRRTTNKKEEEVETEKSKVKKGNLTHLQDKERIVKIPKRNAKNKLVYGEVKASEYTVTDKSDKFIHFVERSKELQTNRRNIEDPLIEERPVRIIDTASFVKAAAISLLHDVHYDANGDIVRNFDENKFDASAVFTIISNMKSKLVKEAFSFRLEDSNGYPLRADVLRTRVKSLTEELKNVRMGGVFISASDILHIPDFKEIKINEILTNPTDEEDN